MYMKETLGKVLMMAVVLALLHVPMGHAMYWEDEHPANDPEEIAPYDSTIFEL